MYNLAIYIANAGIWIASKFSEKVAQMRQGRKETFEIIETAIQKRGEKKVFWVHCASLGEFEQGRPVIERLRKRFPDAFIALSFFSPSGYNVRKNYDQVDVVFYLPSDTHRNMKRLVGMLNPDALFVVKYEYWHNMLKETDKAGCPIYLFSALFQPNMVFFQSYGAFFRKMLKRFKQIYVQDSKSKELLATVGLDKNVFITGDTRFDRVIENRDNAVELPLLKCFTQTEKEIIVCGSTWNADMDILIPFILESKDTKFIIAPHQIHEEDISSIEAALMPRGVLRYTQTNKYDNLECPGVIIIDCVGILNSAYQYGKRAYIGGGFGAGIHNILEAAVWGLPLVFGPNYERFKEAVDLVELEGAWVVKNFDDLMMRYNDKNDKVSHACDIVKSYVDVRKGASDMIINNIFGKL